MSLLKEKYYKNDVFNSYERDNKFLDEVFDNEGKIREHYQKVYAEFNDFTSEDFKKLNELAKISFFNLGITFAVYSDNLNGVEKIFPFDLFPRIITYKEWEMIEKGVIQRNLAINAFLYDIYHEKHILKNGIVPAELIFSSAHYNREMINVNPSQGIYAHISGTDLIKHSDGEYYVLEDNIRSPSGVSYVLSNREAMKRSLSNLFKSCDVLPVQDYSEQLLATIQSVAPANVANPTCVILTPGMFNSAYYEHSFLAQSMGIQLVEGRDLFVERNFVYMKTIHGPERVDVIYRRIDDDFIDPLTFNPDSALGVPGLMGAYREGNVNLINAPGTGAADDKAVYTFIPDIIRYYLNEEPILRNVHTYKCESDLELKYVLENMEKLVIKPVDESGGYGIFIGSVSTEKEMEDFRKIILANRRKYIAQPIMALSVHSTYIDEAGGFEPRHIDLRTYCLLGKNKNYVLKGGLSRVALRKGSLIVNSSQGGGSKDTWVLKDK